MSKLSIYIKPSFPNDFHIKQGSTPYPDTVVRNPFLNYIQITLKYHANTVVLLEIKILSVKYKKGDASSYKKNVNFFSQKIIPEIVTWHQAPLQFPRLSSNSLASFQMSSVKVPGPEWERDKFFSRQCCLLNGPSPPHQPFSQPQPFYTTQGTAQMYKFPYNIIQLNLISIKKVTERRQWPTLNAKKEEDPRNKLSCY